MQSVHAPNTSPITGTYSHIVCNIKKWKIDLNSNASEILNNKDMFKKFLTVYYVVMH